MSRSNSQVYMMIKDKVDTLSVQIIPQFVHRKEIKIGGRYCGYAPYNAKATTERLYEILINDGLSDFFVIAFANEFEEAVSTGNIAVGDVIISDGIMFDTLDGGKLVMIYSISKEA